MYATKPLSVFKRQPEAVLMPPSEGGNSGYLVVKSNTGEDDDEETICCGTCIDNSVWELPFPQNCVLTVRYSKYGEAVVFVPVPDQPLASNRYYIVVARGGSRGLVRTCSREEDMTTCFCRCISDVNPRPFDPADVYQQMEIVQLKRGMFTAKAVADDGFPPMLYQNKGWVVDAYESNKKNKSFDLGEASGLDDALRSRWLCPTVAFPPARTDTTAAVVVVGRWYCPFYLIKEEGVSVHKQMDRSVFYEVTLEQRWEPVVVRAHDGGSKQLASKMALIGGSMEAWQESPLAALAGSSRHDDAAYVWFRAAALTRERVGLCVSVWERMLWVERRGGWVDNDDACGSVVTEGSVLIERFVVKRMDGSVVLALDFTHLHKVKEQQQL